jgi:hypothetical protein
MSLPLFCRIDATPAMSGLANHTFDGDSAPPAHSVSLYFERQHPASLLFGSLSKPANQMGAIWL